MSESKPVARVAGIWCAMEWAVDLLYGPDLAAEVKRLRAEREVQPCGHPMSMLLRSAETGAPLYCEACDDKSGRRDAEQREQELQAALAAERRKVEALEKALRMLHAICRDCDLETEATRPTEEQYIAAMDAAEAALASTEGGA